LDSHSKKVLITGVDGFTGTHLAKKLRSLGMNVVGTTRVSTGRGEVYELDITDKEDVTRVLNKVKPDYIIHLAAISFVAHADSSEFYKVNVIGTENILQCALESKAVFEKIIISSSANVYGNNDIDMISELASPEPVNHYACSKLAMEKIIANYFNKLPIIISRPFNYTGIGQANHFLVPKIVAHFKEKKSAIELGNLDVSRDFSSIDFVVDSYVSLLLSDITSEVVNICSGRSYSLLQIIEYLEEISGDSIDIRINPSFVRENEVKTIAGDNRKLLTFCPNLKVISLYETLSEMYKE
jgi:nucleoside-diphosphate-sugar epimerase|tara:strand:- start:20015 stop:20908 length:894 start_codon:yes stop_codon:yes gene_type:complete